MFIVNQQNCRLRSGIATGGGF